MAVWNIWPSEPTPGSRFGGDGALTMGVAFQSSVAGTITGVKYYRSSGVIGTVSARLYTTDGTLQRSANFTEATSDAWNEVTFGTGYSAAADTTYIVAIYHSGWDCNSDSNYFSSAYNSGGGNPLTALASGSAPNGNGVYIYSDNYPNNSFNASNYWVDVIFETSGAQQVTGTGGHSAALSAAHAGAGTVAQPQQVTGTAAVSASITAAFAGSGTSVVSSGPTISSPTILNQTTSGFDIRFTTDTDNGTAYYVVYPTSASDPTATQIVAGTDGDDGAAIKSGSMAISTTGVQTFPSVTGLSSGTTYRVSVVHYGIA